MPVVKLNARNITTLPAIGGLRTDYRDELLPGFFLRVTPQGTCSFGIVYTTRDGRLSCRPRKRRRGGRRHGRSSNASSESRLFRPWDT
jgi:hypothetical protein